MTISHVLMGNTNLLLHVSSSLIIEHGFAKFVWFSENSNKSRLEKCNETVFFLYCLVILLFKIKYYFYDYNKTQKEMTRPSPKFFLKHMHK